MKTLTTLFISIITLVATATANDNLTISSAIIATTSLNGGTINNTIVLNWSAKNSTGKSRFEIQRSFYSNNFTTIASMQTAFTNNSNFRINDIGAELAGRKIAYYRIKQTDAAGIISYSNVTVVNVEGAEQSSIVKKNTNINFTAAQNGTASIKIMNASGTVANVKNAIVIRGNNTIELENINGLAKGIYTAIITVNGVVIDTQKVISE